MTNNNYDIRIAELETQIEKLQSLLNTEVASLAKKIADCEEGVGYYIEKHGKEHCQLLKMIWPAYYKTCPEYISSLSDCENALSKSSDGDHSQQP